MKLSPRQYKNIINISLTMHDYYNTNNINYRQKYPKIYKLSEEYGTHSVFFNAVQDTIAGEENAFTKAFS